jgi:serine/threonine protein kinase
MELLTGGSLKDLLAGGPLSALEALTCGIQISSALQHAHNHGIIHRDLKPSNLMFDDQGNLKLVDFGIARDTHGADITSTGLTVGSYAYMAPEQIQGKNDITGHVDLYAFGCLLFEMLAGTPPFQGDNFAQLFEQHLNHLPQPLSRIQPNLPPGLEQLVNKLLEKSPEQRPFSARAVQGILLEMADQKQTSSSPGQDVSASKVFDRGREVLAGRLRRRYRQVSWYSVVGIFFVGAFVVWAFWMLGSK